MRTWWRRARSLRAAALAALYVGALAFGFTGLAGAVLPAPALAAPAVGTIKDCTSSTELATAVLAGGPWTFACNGTIVVNTTLDVATSLTLVVPPTDPGVTLQQGSGGNAIFLMQGGNLNLTGNGHLTLESDPAAAAAGGVGVSPLVYDDFGDSVTLAGTTVTDTVVGATYAPVYNAYGSLTVTGDTFVANHGDRGGAIYNAATLTVTGTTFTGNQADYDASGSLGTRARVDAGGAIYNDMQGTLSVADSTFTDNVAVGSVNARLQTNSGAGGGIYNFGAATITDSTFAGNQAEWASKHSVASMLTADGGAIDDEGGSLVLANSTLTANRAYQLGGGLAEQNYFDDDTPPTAFVYNATFASNTATTGGDNLAFNSDGSLPPIMKNDIMYDLSPVSQDCAPDLPATSTGQAGNLEQGDGSCSANGTLSGWKLGNADLQTLSANPGAYPDATHPLLPDTMALGPASQAIGLGDSAVCQDKNVGAGGVDERGMARPAGTCDAGAYQSLGITLTAAPATVTIHGGNFDTASVSGTVYTDSSAYGLADMPVTLSLPAGSGTLSATSATTDGSGDFSASYSAPASVPDPTPQVEAVTVTAMTYGQAATAVVDVLSPPYLTGLTPTSGAAGTTLTLSGLHFEYPGNTAGYVSFTPAGGGTPVQVIASTGSDTSATVAVPSRFAAGTQLWVAVQNPKQGLFSNKLSFTVTSGGGSGGGNPPLGGGVPVAQIVPTNNTCGTITLASGSALTASAGTSGTPAGLAPDARAASCVFTLTGPAPAQPQAVTIQYNPDVLGSLPPTRISIFRLRSDGLWTFLPSRIDAASDTVTADVSGPATLVALADVQIFPDVPAGYWAAQAIDVAAAAEMVDGFPPPFHGLYQPAGPLTRAQAAKMVVVDAQLLPQPGSTPFADVLPGDWFAPYIATGYRAGIVQGMSATTFGPNQAVTREQFAVMLARALKLKGSATLTFADVGSIAPWALPAVEAVVAAGYFQGMPGNLFQPLGTFTRAQAAEVMARVVKAQAPTTQP